MSQRYSASRLQQGNTELVCLADATLAAEVLIAPPFGNRAVSFAVNGRNALYFPHEIVDEARGERGLNGIPFLAPWANRMTDGGFRWEGARYRFQDGLRLDANGLAIHGLLTASPLWEVTSLTADAAGASVTSRLEFWRHPQLMANWPIAHAYDMTYRLEACGLSIETSVRNLSSQPMPVALGFHPYFEIPGAPRDAGFAHLPVRKSIAMDPRLVATGEYRAVSFPERVPLAQHTFDEGFTDLIRNPNGEAVFRYENGDRAIEVGFGPKFGVAIIYAPKGQNFICFEPMTAVTNAVNLAADGLYPDLQVVNPGETWQETFRVRLRGF